MTVNRVRNELHHIKPPMKYPHFSVQVCIVPYNCMWFPTEVPFSLPKSSVVPYISL